MRHITRSSRCLPKRVEGLVRFAKNFCYPILYRGKGRWCPVCTKESRKFLKFGIVPREDALCPQCNALERHRFVWLYFSKMTNLFDGVPKSMLHIAPEKCFESQLKSALGKDYITADLLNPRAMVRMDITDIQYPDGFFDVAYCSHVLEHVPDDQKAMRELFRVLKQGGRAILLVPIDADRTIEGPSIVDPSERLRVFGRKDHVRRYGPDFIERLREAGFKIRTNCVSDLFEESDIVRMGLTPASGEIFDCFKCVTDVLCAR